jgi:hypothetical protein
MQQGLAEQLATKVLREAEEQILGACRNEELGSTSHTSHTSIIEDIQPPFVYPDFYLFG